MNRIRIVGALVVSLLLVGTAALAQTSPSDTVDQLNLRGYYADEGVDVDIDELERLVASTSEDVFYVALAEDPADGADLFATEVLDRIEGDGTVIVVSPGEIGARSTIYDDAEINEAVDASLETFNDSYVRGFAEFAATLTGVGAAVATTQAESAITVSEAEGSAQAAQPNGGGNGGLIFVLIIVAIGAVIFFMVRSSKRKQEAAFEGRIDEIKNEIRGQLGEVANDILELEDEVMMSDNSQAKDLYAAGSQGYAEFEEKLDAATTLAELNDLAEGLDRTQWQLEAAEALVDGEPLPPKPADRPDYEPPPSQPRPPSRSTRADLPPDLQMRRERGEKIDAGRVPQRRRSGGWLGGLGTAAVILKSIQQGQQRRSRTGIQWPGSRNTSPRQSSTGVNVPDLGGGTSKTTSRSRSSSRSGRSSRSSRGSSGSSSRRQGKSMKGRARRKR